MRLALERIQEARELIDPPDGRDDEVESHGRTLTLMPLVSALIAVHNDAAHIRSAIDSVLQQTFGDLELIIVDDASTDDTPALLDGAMVVRNETQLGLAGSLNRGLEHVGGRYVARLDSDDVARPEWVARLLARMRAEPRLAVVGTGIVELVDGREGATHRLPTGALPVRWHALFSAPFFHSTVLIDKDVLEAHGLRYDARFGESEDYDLWARLLHVADGDNLPEPLVLRRMHPAQAQARRGELQRSFQREIALREIRALAPEVDAESAWRVGARLRAPFGARREFLRLLAAFERRHGRDRAVRNAAFRALASPRRRT
jgi:glycosyltransferase involved in cell wall biosynthesis